MHPEKQLTIGGASGSGCLAETCQEEWSAHFLSQLVLTIALVFKSEAKRVSVGVKRVSSANPGSRPVEEILDCFHFPFFFFLSNTNKTTLSLCRLLGLFTPY